jgi:hypothetical protein
MSIRAPTVWLVPLLAVCLAALSACLGLSAVAVQRVELFHAALFNACTLNSYALHWQNAQRLPQALRYDFTLSPDTLLILELWIADGPTLSFSQSLTLPCWRIT